MKKPFLFLMFFEILILFSNSFVKGIYRFSVNDIKKLSVEYMKELPVKDFNKAIEDLRKAIDFIIEYKAKNQHSKKTTISEYLINFDEKYPDFDWDLICKDENFIGEGSYKEVYKYPFEGVDRAFVFFSKSKDDFYFKKNLFFNRMYKDENIAEAFAYSDEQKCIIFECADYDLFDFLNKKKLTLEQKIKLFRSISLGVKYLHDNSIIHGDLKPENILVFDDADNLFAKIIDFDFYFSPSDKKQKTFLGTVRYTHPAIFLDKIVSLPREIYSLGIILYMILFHEDISSFVFNFLDKRISIDNDFDKEFFDSIFLDFIYKIYKSGIFKKGLEYYIGNLYISYLSNESNHRFDGISLKDFNFLRKLILYCLFDENANIDTVLANLDKLNFK